MWLFHTRVIWSCLVPKYCLLPLIKPGTFTVPSENSPSPVPRCHLTFGRGGSNLSFILWDSAYHLLLGCSLCGPILERCLALDSHPDYLWTQILATCLCFWWLPVLNILFFQTLSASKEGFSFVQDLCVNNLLPKLWTFPTTFIFYVLFCSLDFFQLL